MSLKKDIEALQREVETRYAGLEKIALLEANIFTEKHILKINEIIDKVNILIEGSEKCGK